MKAPKKRRPDDGWGAPQAHRTLYHILKGIAEIEDRDERISALKRAPRVVRDFLYWVYGNYRLDLTRDDIGYVPVPTSAFAEGPALGDEDLMGATNFLRLFSREVLPNLSSRRRHEIWVQLLERLPADERSLLDHVRRHRALPWPSLSSAVVRSAFPGVMEVEPMSERPPESISYPPSAMDNPLPIVEAPPKPAAPREKTPSEKVYEAMMIAHGWGKL
jgi:hypothetical protein